MHISFVDAGLIMVRQTWVTFGVLAGPDDAGEILHGAERCARRPQVGPEHLVAPRVPQEELAVGSLAEISARPMLLVHSLRHKDILLKLRRDATLATVTI